MTTQRFRQTFRTMIGGAIGGAALLLVTAQPAAAQALDSYGVRAGVSVDPDQFYFGGHVQTEPLIDHLRFRPNVEIGLGDHATLVAFNVEFAYFFPQSRSPWQIYAGGGPALNVINFDPDPGDGDTHAEPGLNMLVGVQHAKGLFFEFKVGAFDSPDFKFGVGYSWKR